MKTIIRSSFLFIIITMILWSCSEASGKGSFSMVLSGSMHGQLDPCG